MTKQIFLARQPILDSDRRTFGYELLYRNGPDNVTRFDDPEIATQSVIERAVLDWGMERLIGDRFGFINAGPRLITGGLHRALPPEGIIIEICEPEPFDGSVVDAIARARRDGYHFALDNVDSLSMIQNASLFAHVSMVKVQMSISRGELAEVADYVKTNRPGVLLVAERVETVEQFTAASDAGYDLFEGYFFAEPEVLSKAARPSSVHATFSLLAEIQRPDIDVNRVEQLVGTDASLAYRILSVVNSSAFGLDRRVDSLRHAIVLLGVEQVRHLAVLLAMSASSSRSEELIAVGATRARLASSLSSLDQRNAAFTVGLLSVTDALYGTEMEDLLQELPVSDEISAALLHGTGELGNVLNLIRACEAADLEEIDRLAPGRVEEVRLQYADAVEWVDGLCAQLGAPASMVQLPSSDALAPAPA